MVVWRTDLYKQEAFRQLADTRFYAKVNKDLTQANQKIVKGIVNKLISEQKLSSTARNLFVTTPKTSTFYLKSKIHKPNNPGRPIISACSCPTEPISSFLDKKMAPIVKSLPTYIKDTNHALNILKQFSYTAIPNNKGLLALKYFFDQRTVKEPSTDTLLRLAELVLTLNCFTFFGEIFKQINGVAMGTKMGPKMGPNYANLFVDYVEEHIFNQFDGPKPEHFGRYIDDCLGATSCTKEELERFIDWFCQLFPSGPQIHMGNIWNLSHFSRYQHFCPRQQFGNQCPLQTHRFAQLLTVLIFPPISCQRLNSILPISQTQ